MTQSLQPRQPLAIDVLVVGAGSAGVAAAVSAAEEGARTLLVEAAGNVGGTLAGQLLEHSAGFHNREGQQVVAGFAQRLVDRMQHNGASPGHVPDNVGYTATRTPVNHTELMLTEAQWLHEVGVGLWLQAPLTAVERRDKRIVTCEFATPAGPWRVAPQVVVDTSGDAVVAHLAQSSFQPDSADACQPVSLLFKLAGVDFRPLMDYARSHPEEFRPGSVFPDAAEEHINLWGFTTLLQQGHRDGRLDLLRNEMHIAGWPQRGELVVNVTRHASEGRPDAEQTGDAWLALCRQIMAFAGWFRQSVPGCARAYVAAIGNQVGVRESRRVQGHYTLTQHDVQQGAHFADSIACGGFPVDIHSSLQPGLSHTDAVGRGFEIAYRSLLPLTPDNLLVAGRCLSSDHAANGSLRITATCFATGEAAGVAAALAVQQACLPAQLPAAALRARLVQRGAIISLDSACA
ncbi:FAD-dependent oxidoreductase [Sodalis praecaptivus]|nr:FAD-dependent oxidoreductase [Sodalis praecaptivus]